MLIFEPSQCQLLGETLEPDVMHVVLFFFLQIRVGHVVQQVLPDGPAVADGEGHEPHRPPGWSLQGPHVVHVSGKKAVIRILSLVLDRPNRVETRDVAAGPEGVHHVFVAAGFRNEPRLGLSVVHRGVVDLCRAHPLVHRFVRPWRQDAHQPPWCHFVQIAPRRPRPDVLAQRLRQNHLVIPVDSVHQRGHQRNGSGRASCYRR
ncbi:non-ribosomal peptide synthetase [Babesia caballi]|uniref:Non-ribosomal peptide synthetase n=1 Tax=Babesia caballi TaxID=5871 RepID=A0AAV4M4W9_BABCB|nr:non-ribosomal peptide synthetase [Babesia caballi]